VTTAGRGHGPHFPLSTVDHTKMLSAWDVAEDAYTGHNSISLCVSPISLSTSPHTSLACIGWQKCTGSLTCRDEGNDENTSCKMPQHYDLTQAGCLGQIEMLKKKLAECKDNAKKALAHCKGLEQTLARQQKKARALEAINESLRQQLVSTKLLGAGSRGTFPQSHELNPVFEGLDGDDTGRAAGPEHTRAWSRFSTTGVLSPCKRGMTAKQDRGVTPITPICGAQACLEKVSVLSPLRSLYQQASSTLLCTGAFVYTI